jgi:hypothetical protein
MIVTGQGMHRGSVQPRAPLRRVYFNKLPMATPTPENIK